MAEDNKTTEDETQSAGAAAASDMAEADVANGTGSAEAAGESGSDGGEDTLDALLAERDALKDQLLRALADV